ncbi:winged helix-turn-helix domain-containing protein [Variovorax sp. GB1P17]|uniref:winged helix-turn-helix domain-containing protein n=1 Tax=Variovorax sp. GB1P17 TaxID=3443740 RepID=UPI003F4692CA
MNEKRAPHHVALIDGLATQRVQLRRRLEHAGCTPVLFEDSSELLALLCSGRRFDLLLIVEDGASTWRQLVTVCRVFGIPTLLLAANSGFERAHIWGQDFPISPLFDFAFLDCNEIELQQRMLRLLHHGSEHKAQLASKKGSAFGNYEFHEGICTVSHLGREINLQPRQFKLALELFRNIGSVLERNRLWALLWTTPLPSKGVRTLDVCVANVRKKLELFPENGFALKSVYGRGYQLLSVAPLKAPMPEFVTADRTPVGWAVNSSSSPGQASSSPH